jgi:predicted transcriptional regulator
MKEYDPLVGIRMPEELKKELFEVAKAQDLTPSQIVRRLVKEWLAAKPQASAGN